MTRTLQAIMKRTSPMERRWLPILLCVGIGLRLLIAFPVYQSPAQSDVVLAGMCSERVLSGDFPVFYAGFRNGSIVCFASAAVSFLTGPGRALLALEPVVMSVPLMLFWYLFSRSLCGWRTALVALPFIAIPTPSVGFWLSMPNSYPETMTLCAAILWLAVESVSQPSRTKICALGIVMGLGFWNSILTLGVSVPAAVWIVGHRRQVVRPGFLGVAGASFVLGSIPLWVFNLKYGWPTFTSNFAARPASDGRAVLENLVYLLETNLPLIAADLEPTHLMPTPGGRIAEIVVTLVVLFAFVLYFVARTPTLPGDEDTSHQRWLCSAGRWLVAGVLLTVCLFFVISEPGSLRTLTVRYVLPIALLVPLALAVLLRWTWARSRLVAVAAGLVIIVFNIAALELPWQESRKVMAGEAAAYDALMSELSDAGVEMVIGPYWDAYSATYLSNGRITGVPIEPENDHLGITEFLPAQVRRWALITSRGSQFEQWVSAVEIPGRAVKIGKFEAYIFDPGSWPARETVIRMQTDLPRR